MGFLFLLSIFSLALLVDDDDDYYDDDDDDDDVAMILFLQPQDLMV